MKYSFFNCTDMNRISFLAIMLLFVLFSCRGTDNTELVKEYVFDKTGMIDAFPEKTVVSDVKLEMSDSVMVEPNSRLRMNKDDYFVFLSGSIYHYNSDGKFLNKIGGVGHAINEYTELRDVCLSPNGKEVEVLTYLMVKKYDYSGKLLKNINTDIFATSFYHDKDYYWFYTGVNTCYTKYEIVRTDENLQNRKEFIDRGYKLPASTSAFCVSPVKSYRYMFSNDIFHIIGDTIVPAYKYRFPDYEMPESLGYSDIEELIDNQTLENSCFTAISSYLENERYIFLMVEECVKDKYFLYHWIIDKKEDKELVVKIPEQEREKNTYYTNPQLLTEDNILYFLGTDKTSDNDESVHVKGVDLSKMM